jgi:hypothetical protein
MGASWGCDSSYVRFGLLEKQKCVRTVSKRREFLTRNQPLPLWVPINDLPGRADQSFPPGQLPWKTIVTLDWEGFASQRDADGILWKTLALRDNRVPNLRPWTSLKVHKKAVSKGAHDPVPKESRTLANLLRPDRRILLQTAHVQEIERDGVLWDALK